jgi:Fic family protein
METKRELEIVGIILQNSSIGISDIQKLLATTISIPTLNRELANLKNKGYIITEGKGPSLKYTINLRNLSTVKLDQEVYFKTEIDERRIIEKFNMNVFAQLKEMEVFDKTELKFLDDLNEKYRNKIKGLSNNQFAKEFERLMIELSWKSAQIEGNTYDLLDTEQLLRFNISSETHTKEEAQMLLNHKSAINYTFENKDLYEQLSISKIIDIHTLVSQKMGIAKNIRKRIVRITGTKYLPPENQFLIEEALERLCDLINVKQNFFEKTFLTILLLSYIQGFEDGNKRTARLAGNAILMNNNACPLSYRSVNPTEYKKAVLMFYELNNISAFKTIFMTQFQFAVENYF